MVEFFVVAKCPMEGLYKNAKLARQVSGPYKDAVVTKFQAPEGIAAAQKYCEENHITVHQNLWQALLDRVKADQASKESVAAPAEQEKAKEEPVEAVVVSETVDEKKASALPVIRKSTVPVKQHHNSAMQLPQWASAVIFTDGSVCPKDDDKDRTAGGYAALMIFRFMANTEIMVSGHKKNPKGPEYMEMMAIYKALKHLKKYKLKGKGKVALYCDSLTVVESYNTKLAGWQECGWKLRNGKHVKHWKLWRKIWKASRTVPLQVNWVKGHANNKWNIRCDMTAKAEAKLRVG